MQDRGPNAKAWNASVDDTTSFIGRSDNFAPGLSTNPNDARLDMFAIANPSASGAAEIANNSTERVTNKGMEGMAITPDGTALIGFMQSPLAQDGGDGGQASSKAWRSVKT